MQTSNTRARGFTLVGELDISYLVNELSARQNETITVIVPIFNAADSVAACIRAVAQNTPSTARLLFIDDASTQPEIQELLEQVSTHPNVSVMRNSENLGFTKTVNRGFQVTNSDDVVILNSDTEVGPQWLQRLRWVAYSQPQIGTVSAVSDNSGIMSVPTINKNNIWHPRLSGGFNHIARIVAREMYVWSDQIPVGHGFCMYIRRDLLNEIGVFDEEVFPFGYGEEQDFCLRAGESGWKNMVAPHVFVHHRRTQSFTAERKKELVTISNQIIKDRYPYRQKQLADWREGLGRKVIEVITRRLASRAPSTCNTTMVLFFTRTIQRPIELTGKHVVFAVKDNSRYHMTPDCPGSECQQQAKPNDELVDSRDIVLFCITQGIEYVVVEHGHPDLEEIARMAGILGLDFDIHKP